MQTMTSCLNQEGVAAVQHVLCCCWHTLTSFTAAFKWWSPCAAGVPSSPVQLAAWSALLHRLCERAWVGYV